MYIGVADRVFPAKRPFSVQQIDQHRDGQCACDIEDWPVILTAAFSNVLAVIIVEDGAIAAAALTDCVSVPVVEDRAVFALPLTEFLAVPVVEYFPVFAVALAYIFSVKIENWSAVPA